MEGGSINPVLEFLVTSSLFTALCPSSVCLVTFYLTGHPFLFVLPLTVFSATLLIYTMNRFTDRNEDLINNPQRFRYIDRYGRMTLVVAATLYLLSLGWLLRLDLSTFIVAVLPVVIAVLYSVFRLKRMFLAKNISVSSGAVCSSLIVLFYFHDFSPFSLELSLFFFVSFLINTIVFDIKDIAGDARYHICTLPSVCGLQKTKIACSALLLVNLLLIPVLASSNPDALLLLSFIFYIGLYIAFAGDPRHLPPWFYGIVVDGEFLFLGVWYALLVTMVHAAGAVPSPGFP